MASQCVVKIYKTKAKTKKHTLKSKDRWKRENVTANINKLFRCIDSICRLSTKQLFHSLCSLCWLWCVYARAKLLDLFFVVFFFEKRLMFLCTFHICLKFSCDPTSQQPYDTRKYLIVAITMCARMSYIFFTIS